MIEDESSAARAETLDQAPRGHCNNFEEKDVAIQKRAIRLMWPGLSSRQIAAALDGRISAGAVRQWQAGIRPIPPWVRNIICDRGAAILEAGRQIKIGPGSRAGWNNLGAWHAARNKER